jgi:hypothetical protein
VKWIDKTGSVYHMQRAETNSARLFSTPAGSSNIGSNLMATSRPPKNLTPSSVRLQPHSQHAGCQEAIQTLQEHQRSKKNKITARSTPWFGQHPKHRNTRVLSALLALRQPQHPFQDQNPGSRLEEMGEMGCLLLASGPCHKFSAADKESCNKFQQVERTKEVTHP